MPQCHNDKYVKRKIDGHDYDYTDEISEVMIMLYDHVYRFVGFVAHRE